MTVDIKQTIDCVVIGYKKLYERADRKLCGCDCVCYVKTRTGKAADHLLAVRGMH